MEAGSEMEAGSGDVADSADGENKPVENGENAQDGNDDDDGDDDEGKMRPHRFDKNIYTFSAAAGRALQQQTGNIRSLV